MTTRRAPIRRIAWLEPARLPHGYDDQNIYTGVLFPRGGPKMAGLLKSLGYGVEVISGEASVIDPDEIARDFDLACISVLSNTAPHGLILARWLSERGLPVILGGYQFAHSTATPETLAPTEEALDFAPYVIRGEGYSALPALLEALAGKRPLAQVPGLSYRTEAGEVIHNLMPPLLSREAINELPLQDWSVVRDREKMLVVGVHGMQGCPRECSWCAVWPRDGRSNRNTDACRLVDELEHSLQQAHFRSAFFSADNFPVLHPWARAVCEEILRRGVKVGWSCQGEVRAVQRTELVDLMQEAGCARWCLGFESINNASLADSQKRQTRETMETAVRELRRRGIHIHGMFIVGLPHDTPETVRETVAWAKAMQIETVQFLCLSDLPGSQDYEQQRLWEKACHPFGGAYSLLNWMFVNGHYARLGNETMSYADVQEASVAAMRSFYSLPRALATLLRPNLSAIRYRRRRGDGWRAALAAGCWHSLECGYLRLRGYINMRKWLRSPLNRAYRRLLTAEGEPRDRLVQQMLDWLPAGWLATLEQVYAERQARRGRQEERKTG